MKTGSKFFRPSHFSPFGHFLLRNTLNRRICNEISPNSTHSLWFGSQKILIFSCISTYRWHMVTGSKSFRPSHISSLAIFCSETLWIAGFVMKYRLIPPIHCSSEPKKYPLFHAYLPMGVILNPSQNLSLYHTFHTLAVFCSRTL